MIQQFGKLEPSNYKEKLLGKLKHQNVVVIGGSSGIGLAVGKLAAEEGAHLTLVSRSAENLERAKAEVPSADVFQADIADEKSVNAVFAQIKSVDHVYVAAGSTLLSNILEGDIADQLEPFSERVFGSIYVARAAVPKLRVGGSICFTGGLSTDRPVPGAWVSGIGTATVEQLARVLALELAPIRFNALSPGYTDTPMWDRLMGENKAAVLQEIGAKLPVRRVATAEEVASAAIFLMVNPSITGEIIHIDGGARLV